jgi:hypothetical protein
MKLTESHLRNLIKQELKQFLNINEGYDTSSNLDSLDTEISDEDEDEELNALEPDLDTPFPLDPKRPIKTIPAKKIRDDANELGLYDEEDPMHVAAQARSRRFRK